MNNRGFTLIELLVVVAIIGMLSSVVLAALGEARASARDSKRLSDLRQMQTALELYYQNNGAYPIQTSWHGTTPGCYNLGGNESPNDAIPGLAPTYIQEVPQDPRRVGNYCYLYRSSSTGTDYKFLIYNTVETRGDLTPDDPFSRCAPGCTGSHCTQSSYAVYTDLYQCS